MHRQRLALSLFALLLAVPAFADDPQKAPVIAVDDVPQAALQVAIDPVTGQLRPPTPEEARALADGLRGMLNDSSDGLAEVALPDGGVAIDLEGRFMNVIVAYPTPEGDLDHQCISSQFQIDGVIAAATAGAKE